MPVLDKVSRMVYRGLADRTVELLTRETDVGGGRDA
jgi:hypothetical protein